MCDFQYTSACNAFSFYYIKLSTLKFNHKGGREREKKSPNTMNSFNAGCACRGKIKQST